MKNKMKKVILSTLIATSSLMAGSSYQSSIFSNIDSLVGIEAGYSGLDVEKIQANSSKISKYNMYHGGLKIGAQSDDFRFLLGMRYYGADDFDYATTYGAELQYLINVAPIMNIFIGVNAGIINMRYLPDDEPQSRTISDPYFGGDVGMNFHLGKRIDLELGARFMTFDAENTKSDTTYIFDNMITGYTSLIFRFEMD